MKINVLLLPHIENALAVKLTKLQKDYLLADGNITWVGGRGSGRTFVHCIRLALSKGEPLNIEYPEKFSDYGDGSTRYARGFYRSMFMDIWTKLNDYGFTVRQIKMRNYLD